MGAKPTKYTVRETCSECIGQGQNPVTDETCNTCDGAGVIDVVRWERRD